MVPTGIRVQLCHRLTAPTQHDLATSPEKTILYLVGGTDEGQTFFMLRGAPQGHDSSVANYRKQESSVSQAIDFLRSDFRIRPRKGNFATEPPRLLPRRGAAQALHRDEGHLGSRTWEEKGSNRFKIRAMRCLPANPIFASSP